VGAGSCHGTLLRKHSPASESVRAAETGREVEQGSGYSERAVGTASAVELAPGHSEPAPGHSGRAVDRQRREPRAFADPQAELRQSDF
jgi:hypothetical protein